MKAHRGMLCGLGFFSFVLVGCYDRSGTGFPGVVPGGQVIDAAKAPFYGADAMRFYDRMGEMPVWARDQFFIEADRYRNKNGQFPPFWHAAKNQHRVVTGKFPAWSFYDSYYQFFAEWYDEQCYFSEATCQLDRNTSLSASQKGSAARKWVVRAHVVEYDWQYDPEYDAYYYVDRCYLYYDDGWYYDSCYDEWWYDGWYYNHRVGEWYYVAYTDEWYAEPYYDEYYGDACYYYGDCYYYDDYYYYDWDYYYYDDWDYYWYDDSIYTDWWYYDTWDSYYYYDTGYYVDDIYYGYDYSGYYGCYDYCKSVESAEQSESVVNASPHLIDEFEVAKTAFWAAKAKRAGRS